MGDSNELPGSLETDASTDDGKVVASDPLDCRVRDGSTTSFSGSHCCKHSVLTVLDADSQLPTATPLSQVDCCAGP